MKKSCFERPRHAAVPRTSRRAKGRSTWHLDVKLLLSSTPLWAPILLGLTTGVLSQQVGPIAGPGSGSDQNKQQTLAGLPVDKLRRLHKQPSSSPQWLDIVRSRGFVGELYATLSLDGKPISIYHLINPLANQQTLNKYPALVFHGLGSDAAHMVSHSDLARPRVPVVGAITDEPSDTALPFMLANNNFDVWMCDARGASLNNHLASNDFDLVEGQKYWNFSLDEQALYDLPVILDFVLAQTHEDKLHFVGFSESTSTMLGLLSTRPEYQDKLATFSAMAPVAYLEHLRGVLLGVLGAVSLVPDNVNGNFVPQVAVDTFLPAVRQFCQFQLFTRTLCPLAINTFGGRSGGESAGDSFYGASIKSSSIKVIKHYQQLYSQHRFGMYDYGPAGNTRQYGRPTPPAYPLANIKLPSILLLRGGQDFLSTPEDQRRLMAELGAQPYLDLFYPSYNHLDFLIGRNVVKEINLPIVRMMFDWTRELACREGRHTMLKEPAKASLAKPVAPIAIVTPHERHPGPSGVPVNLLSQLRGGLFSGPVMGQLVGQAGPSGNQFGAAMQNQLAILSNSFPRALPGLSPLMLG